MSDGSLSPADLRLATVRGLRWTLIARPVAECMLLGSMVVLARLVPPAEFGRYAVAILANGLGIVPAGAITTALVQRPILERVHLKTGFALALLAGGALFVLSFAAADLIVEPAFGARTAFLVRLSTPGCLIAALGVVPAALLQRRLDFRRLSLLDVSGTVVRGVSTIAMAVAGWNGSALVLGVLMGALTVTALSWAWAPAPPPRLKRQAAGELLGYGLPATMASVSWIGFQNCDYAIVGARLGALQAGFYFRAYTLGVEYQKKVSQVMVTVGFPVLARTQNKDEMGALRSQMVRLMTVLLFPLLAILALVAPVLVPWLFGHVWAPAVAPTQILAVGGASTLVIDAVGATLMASGRPRALLGFGWAHFASYGTAVFITAPLGLTAVAVSAAVVHTGFLLVAYSLMLHGSAERPLQRIWEDIGPAVTCSVALVAAAWPTSMLLMPLKLSPVVYLAAMAAVSAGAYLLSLRVCFPAVWASLRAFSRHMLPRRRRRRVTAGSLAAVEVGPTS